MCRNKSQWPLKAVPLLSQLGRKRCLSCDQDIPYRDLQAMAAVIINLMTLIFAFMHPLPLRELYRGNH